MGCTCLYDAIIPPPYTIHTILGYIFIISKNYSSENCYFRKNYINVDSDHDWPVKIFKIHFCALCHFLESI